MFLLKILNNMTNPKISIIIPAYNVELYIQKCVESIIKQKYTNWELLIINDGSFDSTEIICQKLATTDNRIQFLSKQNGGVSSARNLGLDKAIGDWILFVDADDWISSNCLNYCVQAIINNDLDAIQFAFTKITINSKSEIFNNFETAVLNGIDYINNGLFNVCAAGTMMKKNKIDTLNLRFEENIKLAEDQLFIYSYLKDCSRVKHIKDPLYYYYQNPNSATQNPKSNFMLDSCKRLIDFSKGFPETKKYTDAIILDFLIRIIYNGDITRKSVNKIYKETSIGNITSKDGIGLIYTKISIISPSIAYYFVKMWRYISFFKQ